MENQINTHIINHAVDQNDEAVVHALNACGIFVLPMVLNAVVELGVFEVINKVGGDGGAWLSPSQIASQLQVTCSKDRVCILESMLRYLATHSFVTCLTRTLDNGKIETCYGLAPAGRCFVGDESGVSLVPFLTLTCKSAKRLEFWYNLKDAILGDETLHKRLYGNSPYEHVTSNERSNKMFNEAMGAHSAVFMKKILATYGGFEGLSSLVNVGGADGVSLNMIIAKYPYIRGTNFDLPKVIQAAPSYNGIEHVGGDMFLEVPRGDAILLKWILHNWSDEQCVSLLKNCYKSLPNKGKAIVMDDSLPLIPQCNNYAKYASYMNIIMQTMYGGKERTRDEFEALGKKAGFKEVKLVCCVYGMWIMEFLKLE